MAFCVSVLIDSFTVRQRGSGLCRWGFFSPILQSWQKATSDAVIFPGKEQWQLLSWGKEQLGGFLAEPYGWKVCSFSTGKGSHLGPHLGSQFWFSPPRGCTYKIMVSKCHSEKLPQNDRYLLFHHRSSAKTSLQPPRVTAARHICPELQAWWLLRQWKWLAMVNLGGSRKVFMDLPCRIVSTIHPGESADTTHGPEFGTKWNRTHQKTKLAELQYLPGLRT